MSEVKLDAGKEIQAEIRIVLSKNGNVHFEGPLQSKLTCYAMLEAAKFLVNQYGVKEDAELKVQ